MKFIIDANLPYFFSLWKGEDFIHVFDINDEMSDDEIWAYARGNKLTIVTKDADFSTKALFHTAPPKVIHLKTGNLKMKELYNFIVRNLHEIESISDSHKLTNVYFDRIEGIE